MRLTRICSAWALLAAALLAAAGSCTGCGEGRNVGPDGGRATGRMGRLIMISRSQETFWDVVRAGLKDAESKLDLEASKLRVVSEVTDGTPQAQIALLQQLAQQPNLAGVAISVGDPSSLPLADELRKLRASRIPVITFDSDVDRTKLRDARLAFVGTEQRAAGIELGKAAAKLLPRGGGFVTFVGSVTARSAIDRVQGFAEGAGINFVALDNMADESDLVRMRANVREAIRVYGTGLKVLVGVGPPNGAAIADVVRQLGSRNEFKILAFDADPQTIEAMSDGYVDVMVVQNPFQVGYDSVRLLRALHAGDSATLAEMLPRLGRPRGDIYDTGVKVVVPDRGSTLEPHVFSKKTGFFQLSAFRAWLQEWNLSGS